MPGASTVLELTSESLHLEDIERVAGPDPPRVRLAGAARPRVQASRAVIERAVREQGVVYGITTEFGALADVVIVRELAPDIRAFEELVRAGSPSRVRGDAEPVPT